jgi:hypothetical protein
MSQHDYNIANGGGAAVRADLNNALLAVLSQNSGATAPAVTEPFMPWYDTTTGILKIRNAANNAWVTFAAGAIQDASITQAKLGANVASNGPAFSIYLGTNQSVSNSTYTKVQFNTEEFDTAGAFNNTGSTVGTAPAYSFNPQVAGYYQIDWKVAVGTSSITAVAGNLYKNGANYKAGSGFGSPTFTFASSTGSAVVYMNGSTDYLEVYGYVTATTPLFFGSTIDTYFAGVLVRAA